MTKKGWNGLFHRRCCGIVPGCIYFWILAHLLAMVLLAAQGSGAAGDTAAEEFLNETEALVKEIGSFALTNYLRSEDLAATCRDNCSRGVCKPLQRDTFECATVPQNLLCPSYGNNMTCNHIKISRERAFLRWAPDADLGNRPPPCDMKSTICAQQELDKQIFFPATNADFKLRATIYFGSSNGLLRIYPGIELDENGCRTYEVRERNWYVATTAVKKDIVVLLDVGPSMANALSLVTGDQILFDATKNITSRLLRTLSAGDRVSLFTFGNATSSGPAPSKVGQTISVTTTPSVDDPSISSLQQQVQDLSNPDSASNVKANLTAALETASEQFNNSTQMKVILIVTAGDLVGEYLDPSLIQPLDAANVTVFMYRLRGTGNSDGVLSTATLQNASCHLSAYYEEVLYDPQNPLGALSSFHSYVATQRFQTNRQQPIWVPKYFSKSGYGEVITVSYPVFNGSFLVGVAGVNVLVNNLDELTSDVIAALQSRNTITSLTISAHPRFPCSNSQYSLGQTNSICPSAFQRDPDFTGFCSDEDHTSSVRDRACCKGECGWSDSHSLSPGAKAGISVGVLTGVALIASSLFLCWKYYCYSRRRPSPPPTPTSSVGPPTPKDYDYDPPTPKDHDYDNYRL